MQGIQLQAVAAHVNLDPNKFSQGASIAIPIRMPSRKNQSWALSAGPKYP